MNSEQIFNDSYQRCKADSPAFYADFYRHFRAQSPAVDAVFATIDLQRQILMLQESFVFLLNFSANKTISPVIHELALKHRNIEGIKAEMFDQWMSALLLTVAERDSRFDNHVEAAWRAIMGPGVRYIKQHAFPA